MNETASVYNLISGLCGNLLKECGEKVDGFTLNDAKRSAFQILLKTNVSEAPDSEKLLEELQFVSFEMSLANKNKESKMINQVVDTISDKPPEFLQVCWLLLQLKNIDPDPESKQKVRESWCAMRID